MAQLADAIDLNSILANAPGNALIWNRFLSELTQQLSCDSSILLVTDLIKRENTHFLFSFNVPSTYQEKYESELNKLDSFNYFLSKNPKQIFFNQTLNSEYGQESPSHFKLPANQKYRFGVSIPCNHNHALSLVVNRSQAFDAEEQQLISRILNSIIPSLEEALYGEQRYKINSQILHLYGRSF